jgi:CP family cyanate transporter-like MFS transporter
MLYKAESHPISGAGKPDRSGLWLLILGIILVASTLRAPITAVGPVVKAIRLDTGLSNTLTGLLTTLPLLAFAFISPFASRLARRFGMERTLMGGLIVLTAGIILRTLPLTLTLFGGTALVGMGIAICNVLLPGFVKREFPLRVGLMTGLFITSMGVGASLGAGLSNPLAQGLDLGWRGMLACWAVLPVVAGVVWLPRLGYRPQPVAVGPVGPDLPGSRLWHSGLAWQITLFMGLQSLIFYVIVAWLPEMLNQWGLDTTTAGWMLSLFQFVGLPASFIMPVLAGRSANQRWLVIITAGSMVVGFSGLLLLNTALLPLWILLTGFGSGAAISLALTFFVLRSHSPQQTAEISGMAQSIGYLLAATGPTLFGFIHDLTQGWTIPLLMLIIFSVLLFPTGLRAGSPGFVTKKPEAI